MVSRVTPYLIAIFLGVAVGLPASVTAPLSVANPGLPSPPEGDSPALPALLRRQAGCDDPLWDPSLENWVNERVDEQFASWWSSKKLNGGSSTLVDLISTSFGDRGQDCGIGRSNCFVPNCQLFRDNGGPKWVYFVRYALVQMHDLFQNLYDAANTAEGDFTPLIPDLAEGFFDFTPSVNLKQAQPWITAGVETVLSFIPFAKLFLAAPRLLSLSHGLEESTKAFAAGGTTQIGGSGNEAIANELGTIQDLGVLIKIATQDLRENLDKWAQKLFKGEMDDTGKTIIDYMKGGRFTLDYISASDMANWMFQLRIAWLVNRQWLDNAKDHSKKFVMCANSTDVPCNDTSRYTEGGRTCCLYTLSGKATYENATDFAKLRAPQYRFNLSDITASSLRSYLAKGFNYSTTNVNETIMASISVNDSIQLFSQGVKAPGIFTLPVCDVGSNVDWVANWDSKNPMLPCCCGWNCSETEGFYNASAMYRLRKVKDAEFKYQLDKKCSKQFQAYNNHWSDAVLQHRPTLMSIALMVASGIAFAWYL